MINLLITGSDGFIGKNLVEHFKDSPIYSVFSPSYKELDLTDAIAVKAYFAQHRFDYIIHSATVEMVNKDYVESVCELNLRMFFNLDRYKQPGTVVYSLCSGSVYNRADWIPEMDESFFGKNIPVDAHSFSKYVVGKYAENIENTVILRIFGIFGKYEDYKFKFISNSIAKNLKDIPYQININTRYQYLYIDDFCFIIDKLIKNKIHYGVFNVVPDAKISLVDLLCLINKISGKDLPINILKTGWGKEYSGNNDRLRNVLGDLKFTDYRFSIAKLFDYYKANIALIDKEALLEDSFLNYAKKIN